jgi:site-specific recombinase XerD
MRLLEALETFLLQLEADGRSEHTTAQYRRHITLLAGWLDQQGGALELDVIDHGTLARFLTSEEARLRPDGAPKKATAMNALRSTVRTFFGFLHDAGLLDENPARLVRTARCSPPPPRALSEREQERLLAALDADDSDEGRRDRVLFRLLLQTGLRIGSAINLQVADVDLERGLLRIEKAKGGYRSNVVLPKHTSTMLASWIAELPAGWLFRGRKGKPLAIRHAQRRFQDLRERIGLPDHVTLHGLRHTFAMSLYGKTRDVFLLQQALTHRSVSSTMIYARCDERDLRLALGA